MKRILYTLLVFAAVTVRAADWKTLDAFQCSVSRAQFDKQIETLYAPQGGFAEYLQYSSNAVALFSTAEKTGAPLFRLEFLIFIPPISHPPNYLIVPSLHCACAWTPATSVDLGPGWKKDSSSPIVTIGAYRRPL